MQNLKLEIGGKNLFSLLKRRVVLEIFASCTVRVVVGDS